MTARPTLRRLSRLAATALLCLPLCSFGGWKDLDVLGGVTAVYQQEVNSGDNDESLSGDLMFDLPTASGGWFLYIEASSGVSDSSIFNRYPGINGDAGSVLDENGHSHLQVSEFHYRFDFEGAQLTIGEIDPSANLDRSRIANDENTHFLSQGFVNNPTIQFPDYTPGFMYRITAQERRPEVTVIVASSDGIADNPTRSYRDLIDVSAAGKGVFAAAGARWYLDETRIGLGTWLRTDKHEYVDDADRTGKNYGAYFVYGKAYGPQIINFRLGLANERVSRVARFASVAYEREFAAGNLGLGYSRFFESSRARSPASGDSNHVEAWFRTPLVGESLQATGSLQYLSNPGFDSTGIMAEKHALIAGVRLDYSFQ